MVIPLIIGAFFLVDLGVMVVTGKDTIQHLTGIDIYAPIVDPIVDWISGSGGGGLTAEDIIDNQDWWGSTIMDAMTLVFVALAIIALLIILTRPRGHKK